jgi:hypothetical protein
MTASIEHRVTGTPAATARLSVRTRARGCEERWSLSIQLSIESDINRHREG